MDAARIEPVSNSNSLLTGKLTGNFVSFGLFSRFWCPDGERIQWLAAKFPTQRNREFFCGNRECFGANREFSRGIREPPILTGDIGRASPQTSPSFFIARASRPISFAAARTPGPDNSTGSGQDSGPRYPDVVFGSHRRPTRRTELWHPTDIRRGPVQCRERLGELLRLPIKRPRETGEAPRMNFLTIRDTYFVIGFDFSENQ